MIDTSQFKAALLLLQNQIFEMLKKEDPDLVIQKDEWTREGGGGGISMVGQGKVIEQGGANFSHITGDNLPASATAHRPQLAGSQFEAMGVSVVIHPTNPYVPTTHANIRLFIATKPDGEQVWWFGGGFDLTPYYLDKEDCKMWHQMAKDCCDQTDSSLYLKFKHWCDEYFHLKHRGEARGIGGLFFDDFNEFDFETCQSFTERVGQTFVKAYQPIIAKHKNTPFGERERTFQAYRRGRYVEFNLVYDRGTLFGLQTGGRTESILMSLPPIVRWKYQYKPEPNTKESELVTLLSSKAPDWV